MKTHPPTAPPLMNKPTDSLTGVTAIMLACPDCGREFFSDRNEWHGITSRFAIVNQLRNRLLTHACPMQKPDAQKQ